MDVRRGDREGGSVVVVEGGVVVDVDVDMELEAVPGVTRTRWKYDQVVFRNVAWCRICGCFSAKDLSLRLRFLADEHGGVGGGGGAVS